MISYQTWFHVKIKYLVFYFNTNHGFMASI